MRLLITLLLSFCLTSIFAQTPVTWEWESKQVSENEFDLIYKAKIDDGWTVYSQYLESEDGPVATSFNYDDEGTHFELVGKNKESDNAKKKYDKVFDMNLVKFFGHAEFTQRVKVKDFSKPIVGYFTFMTCDSKKCLAPTDIDFTFSLKNTMTKSGGEEEKKEETPEPQPEPEPKPKKEQPTPEKKVNGDLSFNSNGKNGAGGNNKDQEKATAPKVETLSASKETTVSNSSELLAQNTTTVTAPAGLKSDQITNWEISLKKLSETEFNIIFSTKIKDGWYLYSQFQENEDGPTATLFEYTVGEHFELVGEAAESENRKKVYDKVFEMDVQKFSKHASFTQKIKVKDASKPISGYFQFQTCDDKQCTMNYEDFFVDTKSMQALVAGAATDKLGALEKGSQTGNGGNGEGTPKMNTDTIDQSRQGILTSWKDPKGDCGGEENKSEGWFWTFILGFGGGLLALLTPCVFPMIPLTVSFFTKGSKTRAEGIRNGLIYGASIIVIYVAFGLLITGVFGADALNLLSTHWLPNVLFFAIFIVFAISFFGYFEITLPSSWTTKTDSMADKGGLIGTFFMAATLALVSFSCTGPIIGSALVESASNAMGPLVVMLGFSTALALPFGLFAAFPAWLNSLPQSGGWMTSVKVVLGFLELALAFKFLSVADYTYDWGFLRYELFLAIWVIIGLATTLYLLGFIRFPHDSPLKKISPVRGAFIALFAVTTVYLALGFRFNEVTKSYDSPTLLSGLAPPSIYNFFLPTPEVDPEIKKRFPSFTKCANNLDCFKDYYEGLTYAREKNMAILVDFTGKGCVNCRKTEDNIWVVDDVRNNIDTNFVLISLYVDIRDKLPKELFSKAQNKKLRTKGNLWADFQYVNFEQQSQPLYVIMTPEEEVLARPVGYQEGWSTWSDYNEYLNCGLQVYEDVKGSPLGMKIE